jgi:2-phospho-L-lactate guanylyltransferase (CobY/MobA/RfbA family)
MLNAFKNAFEKNYDKVVIVGSDLFDLKETHVKAAFEALEEGAPSLGRRCFHR